MATKETSRATMGRLPGYLAYLKSLPPGNDSISSTVMARDMGLGEVQVRKDLSAVCGAGKPKVGYDLAELTESIERALGCHSRSEVVIVGVGKLGSALLEYSGFESYGLIVTAAFDKNVTVAYRTASGKEVCPVEQLDNYCTYHRVQIGIITVPADAAQLVCDKLVKLGIRAIWSFAPCKLKVPDNVTVQYEDMALSLAHLNNRVNTVK